MSIKKKALLTALISVCIIVALCAALYWLMNLRDFQFVGKIVRLTILPEQ